MGNWTREDPGLFDAGSLGTAATGLQTVETTLGEARTVTTNSQAGMTAEVWSGDAPVTWTASLDTPVATIDAVTTALSAARTAIGAYSETVSGIATRAASVKQTMFESNQVINRQYADPAGGPTPEQAQHRQLQEQAAMGDLTLARSALEGLADERTLADSTLVLALTPPNATAWEAQRQALAAIGITDSGSLTPTAVAQAMAELGNQIASGDYSEAEVSNLQTLYDLYGKNPQVMAQMNLAMGGENVVSLIDELGRGVVDGSIPAAAALALAQSVRGGLSVGSERWSPLTGQNFAEEMMANASTGVGGDPAAIGFLFGDPANAPIGVTTTLALADMIDQEERGNYHIWQDGSPLPGGTTLALLEEEQTGVPGLRVIDLAGRVLETLGQYPDEALDWLTDASGDDVTGEGSLGQNRVEYWYGDRDWSQYDEFAGPAGLWAGTQYATGGPGATTGQPVDTTGPAWVDAATLSTKIMEELAGNESFEGENVSSYASVEIVRALAPQMPGLVEAPLYSETSQDGPTQTVSFFGISDQEGVYANVSQDVLAKVLGAAASDPYGHSALESVVSQYQDALVGAASNVENTSVHGLAERIAVLQGMVDGAGSGEQLGEAAREDQAIMEAIDSLETAVGLIPIPGLGGVVGGAAGAVIDAGQSYALGELIGWGGDTLDGGFASNHAALLEDLEGQQDASLDAVRLQTAQLVWELEHDTPGGPLAAVPDPSGLNATDLQTWFDDWNDELLDALDEDRGGSTFDSLARAYRDGSANAQSDNDSEH